ncbi:MAG: bifunctional diguanylate cyclase/phosphodiesterase [Ketobacteraceae bacterium]|nr:bifunctional diguanylate cyclase/phosphodiesterase [Ketobacteraceae bacterium]
MTESRSDRVKLIDQLQERCDQALAAGETLGLLVVDLLEFRRVNAVYGYRTGDRVLAETEHRLGAAGFKDSACQRIGNDEFVVVLPRVKDPKLLSLAANKVVRVLGEPFHFGERTLRVEPVIGYSSSSGQDPNAEKLLSDAEKNLADAKAQNKRFLTYGGSGGRRVIDWHFESMLHQAVANNDLALFYQPKVNLQTHLPTHAEALARWPHPDMGTVTPADFIPLLEKTGGIVDMTKWAVHTALRELCEWPEVVEGMEYSVAVNVSSAVLEEPEFPDVVKSALSIWGVDPQRLTLEITEGALVQEEHSSYQSIHRLKDLGLKISIDDFGTGYSCLSYFKRLPADELKIDQSFVTNLQKDKDDEHLTRLIIDLAHRFDMSVVAEGIEDKATYSLLREFGCDYAQGYYISRPLVQGEYCEWLENFDSGSL